MSRSHYGTFGETPIMETMIGQGRLRAAVIDYGAVLRDLQFKKADGSWQRVMLSYETLEHYHVNSSHCGSIAGRFANRIAGGKFVLDGVAYQLPQNQAGKHSLHGGGAGFGKRPWTMLHHDADSITLGFFSPDGDANYPGAVTATCRYIVTDGTLRIELTAVTDKATIINLTNHAYFNLDGSPDILDHTLSVRANVMTPVDADSIPDGSLAPVSGTPFDFRVQRPIRHISPDGTRFFYDHNYVLRRDQKEADASGLELAKAAVLASPKSGIAMETWTTEPCIQVYDGGKLNLPIKGRDGVHYGACAGICLETQHAPDSPNLPHLPSTVLRPGEVYRHITEYRFSA